MLPVTNIASFPQASASGCRRRGRIERAIGLRSRAGPGGEGRWNDVRARNPAGRRARAADEGAIRRRSAATQTLRRGPVGRSAGGRCRRSSVEKRRPDRRRARGWRRARPDAGRRPGPGRRPAAPAPALAWSRATTSAPARRGRRAGRVGRAAPGAAPKRRPGRGQQTRSRSWPGPAPDRPARMVAPEARSPREQRTMPRGSYATASPACPAEPPARRSPPAPPGAAADGGQAAPD